MVRKQFLVAAMASLIAVGATLGTYIAISGEDDKPVSTEIDTTEAGDTPVAPVSTAQPESPQQVTPQSGMLDVRPIAWREAEALDSRTVRVWFDSGVEPCYVLDHVTVDYGVNEVAITLYEGTAPQATDTVCIQIAVDKVTDVMLDEPLGNRTIVDGSRPR